MILAAFTRWSARSRPVEPALTFGSEAGAEFAGRVENLWRRSGAHRRGHRQYIWPEPD